AVLVGGGLAPEAVNELHGDTRQQDQPCRAIGLGRPDWRRERDQGEQPCEGRQGRGPEWSMSAADHDGVIVTPNTNEPRDFSSGDWRFRGINTCYIERPRTPPGGVAGDPIGR